MPQSSTRPELADRTDQDLLGVGTAIMRRLPLSTMFIKFLIVGGLGFLINQFMLFLLYDSPVFWFLPAKDTGVDLVLFHSKDIRLLISSVLAVEAAIVFQFNAHECWTFRGRERRGWGPVRFLKFNATAAGGAIIAVVTINVLKQMFGISPYISNVIGTVLGFMWNWAWNTLIIWPQQRKHEGLPASVGSGHPMQE